MANFVEQAALIVKDQSTKQIRAINKALKDLFKTASKEKIEIKLSTAAARKEVAALKTAILGLPKTSHFTLTGTKKAMTDVRALHGLMAKSPPLPKSVVRNTANVKEIGKLTDALEKLNKVKAVNVKVTVSGADASLRVVRELNNELAKIKGYKAAPVIKPPRVNMPPPRPVPSSRPSASVMSNEGSLFGKAAGAAIAFEMVAAIRQLGVSAVKGTANSVLSLDDARLEARVAGFSANDVAFLESQAIQLSAMYPGSSAAQLLGASVEAAGSASDQKTIVANMALIAKYSQMSAGALSLNGQDASEAGRLLFKVIQLSGLANDPVGADAMAKAVMQGVIAAGGDVGMLEVVNMRRQLGTAGVGISPGALMEAILIRDEGGMRGTANMRQAFSDLIRGNLNLKDRRRQIKAGLRDKNGNSLVADQFLESPLDFVANEIIPRLRKLKGTDGKPVDLTDGVAIQNALDNQLGFSKEAGGAFLTQMVLQFDSMMIERERARKATPEVAMEDPSVRMQMNQLNQQMANVAAQTLGPLLPTVSSALDSIVAKVAEAGKTGLTLEDGVALTASVAAAAGSYALYSGLQGFLSPDPMVRQQSAVALALLGSASALTASAAALTGAATVQAGTGGKKGGLIGMGLGLVKKSWPALAAYFIAKEIIQPRVPVEDRMSTEILRKEAYKNRMLTTEPPSSMTGGAGSAWRRFRAMGNQVKPARPEYGSGPYFESKGRGADFNGMSGLDLTRFLVRVADAAKELANTPGPMRRSMDGPVFEKTGRNGDPFGGTTGLALTRKLVGVALAREELMQPQVFDTPAIKRFPDDFRDSAESLRSIFSTGADDISTAADKVGPAASQDLLANATTIGTMIGQAAAAALAGVQLGVASSPARRAMPDYVPPSRDPGRGDMTPF